VLLSHPLASLVDLYRGLVRRESSGDPIPRRPRSKQPSFTLVGVLTAGKSTGYSINGIDFEIEPDTTIFGELRFGAPAHVAGVYRRHTIRVATAIVVAPART